MARSEAAHDAGTTPLALDLWTAQPPALDGRLRDWLTGEGLLTERLRKLGTGPLSLRVVHQDLGTLGAEQRALLGVTSESCLRREVELCIARTPMVYAQTLVPDSTLRALPWLAELGDSPLGEMLQALSGVTRAAYEYADLSPADPLAARAQRDLPPEARGMLPARRGLVTIRGHALLVHEAFLPSLAARALA